MRIGKAVLLTLMLATASQTALADEWIAERLRGGVMQLQNGQWTALERGAVVPDGRTVRTGPDGRLELVRGQERISLAADTEISIRDAAGQKMTSVMQSSGMVTIEAERRNVQHFSVQTPVLAAVVKGTQFSVTYRDGQARVDVQSGVVQVQDSAHEMVVDVTRGQVAEAGQDRPLDVSGPGSERAIFLIEGEIVPAQARDAVLSGEMAASAALETVVPHHGPGPRNEERGPAAGPAGNAGDGPGKGGPGRDNEEGRGHGHGNGKQHGPDNDHAKPNGPANDRGPGNGNGPGANSASGNGKGPGSNSGSGNGHGPGSNSGPGNGHGPGSNSGPGNGNGPDSNSGRGNGNGPGSNSGSGGGAHGNGHAPGLKADLGPVSVEVSSGNGLGLSLGHGKGLSLRLGN